MEHPFQVGDTVCCVVDWYAGLRRGWTRKVLDVRKKGSTNIIVLRNNFSPYTDASGMRTSEYDASNFELVRRPAKEKAMAAYEKTKYCAIRVGNDEAIDGVTISGATDETEWRDTKHQVTVDVGKVIKEGERWLVLQTVMMIEGEEPRPPIRITEYK